MRKILSLLVLLLMTIVGAGSAMADVVAGKVYTIRPYSASTQYVVPSDNWSTLTGGEMATYASEGAKWLIKTSDDSNGVTISLASDWPTTEVNYLNPWGAGSAASGAIGAWKTNNGDDRWTIEAVAGKDGVYTVKNVSTPAVYMFYNSSSELLYFNKPGTPAETNYFYFDEVNDVDFTYTLSVVGQSGVTVSYNGQPISASFTTHELVDPEKVTATDVAGYAYSVVVNGTTVTVTYVEKVVDTSKQYYIKNVFADKYVVINASGNATVSATNKTLVSIEEMPGGFSIKDVNNNTYLSASSWNAHASTSAFAWTIAKTDDGHYSFNQQTATYRGYLGLNNGVKDEGAKLYCNKGTSDPYKFDLEEYVPGTEPEPEAVPVTKLSDIVSTKLYTITSVNRGSFVYNETYASDKISASIRSSYTFSETDPNCQFAFVTEGEKTYLWSKGANKFAVYANPNVATSNLVPEKGLTLLASTGASKATHPVVITIDGSHQINMSTQEHQGVLTTWNDTGDDGNMLRILPVGDLTTEDLANIDELLHPTNLANITYVYKLGEETVAEETNAVAINSELPAPTANLPFYTYTAPEGTVSTDKTYTINLTWDGPFQTDGTTYALGVRLKTDGAANYYVKAQGEGEKVLSRALESVEPSAEALWTFERVAGTADQFYVKNMKFGYINTASGAASTTVAETKTPMVLYAYTGTNHKDGNKDFGFYDVTNNGQIFGDHQTVSGAKYLGYWAGGSKTDAGSAFQVVPTEFVHYDWAAYEARYNKLNAYIIGENLGEYADVLKYLEDSEGDAPLSVWKNYFNLTLTFKEEANYDADMENMQWFLDHMQINLPQKGQLIRIKTSSGWINEPTYLAGEKASNDHLKFVQNPDFNAWAEDNTIWIYDGQYLINYANGLTFATTAAQYGHATLEMYPNTTAVSFQAAQNGTVGKYNVKFAGNRFMYTQNNNLPNLYTDAGSTANSEGYNFELEDATTYFFLDFGDKGWASGYFPIPVAANPEYGIDAAYYIKNDPENNCFQAEPVGYEGHGLIAPFTPVIIKVNSEVNGGRPLVKGAPDYSMQPEESALSGALWKQAKPENCLVFNVVDGNPGFYGYTGATLKHCKAYYEPSAPTESALRINFGEDDTLTGIMEAIEKAEFSGNVFDLQGRRINGVQKGVFVKDGKKVIK